MSRLQRSRVIRLIVAIAVTAPLVFAALYMWIMWDPTKKVNQLPVAIVNADRPVGEGDAQVSAGKDVANKLLETHALDFRLVDGQQAETGLKSGDYYFVVEIPENFSATLASIGDTSVAPALINVYYNDNNTLKASSIGAAAMNKIAAAVLEGVSSTTVGNLVTGVDKLGNGIKQAADGSVRLYAGTNTLKTGVDTLADGIVEQLAPGIATATEGSVTLADGTGQLSDGLVKLQNGTDTLGAGAGQVADGIDKLVTMVKIDELMGALTRLQGVLPADSSVALEQLPKVTKILQDLKKLQNGSRQIATELTSPDASYRSGLNKLVDGGRKVDDGATALSTGMGKLNTGSTKIVDGVKKVQTGVGQLDAGAGTLAGALVKGSREVPDLGDKAQQESLADLVATPVKTESTNLARAQFFGPGGAPTLLILASALVVIVVFMSFRAHRFIEGDDHPLALRPMIRRAAAVTGISLAAMAVVSTIIWNVLSPTPDPASLLQVIVIGALATVMNVAVFGFLFTVFGYVAGALSSLSWMMLQVFSYGGVWMVETIPAPMRWLHPISPMTYVRDGMIAAFNGAPGFAGSVVALVFITSSAAALTFGATKIIRLRGERSGDVGDPTWPADAEGDDVLVFGTH